MGTKVRDLFKWDPGNGYPCWDVEYECSAKNGTRGTGDVKNMQVSRSQGLATASWSRLLDTGDAKAEAADSKTRHPNPGPEPKDYKIANASLALIFANGFEDSFTYHGQDFGACEGLNFFSGDPGFCWWAASGGRR